jgi:hypothetical protein
VLNALNKALREVRTGPEHAPTVALAKRYAGAIDDDASQLARLGRPFLAVLVELRMTPKARAGVMLGDPDDDATVPPPEGGDSGDSNSRSADELAEQRARRDRRQHHTAAVD